MLQYRGASVPRPGQRRAALAQGRVDAWVGLDPLMAAGEPGAPATLVAVRAVRDALRAVHAL